MKFIVSAIKATEIKHWSSLSSIEWPRKSRQDQLSSLSALLITILLYTDRQRSDQILMM